jgi:hypothetical protein
MDFTVFAFFFWEDSQLMTLDHATLIFLVLVFVAAEVYRSLRQEAGVIVSVGNTSLGPVPLPLVAINVRLQSGCEVSANLDCCTACLGRLDVGDEVRVFRSNEGYKVALPWFGSGSLTKLTKTCQCPK